MWLKMMRWDFRVVWRATSFCIFVMFNAILIICHLICLKLHKYCSKCIQIQYHTRFTNAQSKADWSRINIAHQSHQFERINSAIEFSLKKKKESSQVVQSAWNWDLYRNYDCYRIKQLRREKKNRVHVMKREFRQKAFEKMKIRHGFCMFTFEYKLKSGNAIK